MCVCSHNTKPTKQQTDGHTARQTDRHMDRLTTKCTITTCCVLRKEHAKGVVHPNDQQKNGQTYEGTDNILENYFRFTNAIVKVYFWGFLRAGKC